MCSQDASNISPPPCRLYSLYSSTLCSRCPNKLFRCEIDVQHFVEMYLEFFLSPPSKFLECYHVCYETTAAVALDEFAMTEFGVSVLGVLLAERRMAPAALQCGLGPGSGVYVNVRVVE